MYTPSPFENAMNCLREVMFDLDSISVAVDQVAFKYSPAKPAPVEYKRPKSPPANFYPAGTHAGSKKKRRVKVQQPEYYSEDDSEEHQSS